MAEDNKYIRGVLTTGLGDMGFIQSISWSGSAEEDTARDENGLTQYADFFDDSVEASVSVRFRRDSDLPETNDVETLSDTPNSEYDGDYFVISPPEVEESNETGVIVTLNLRRYLSADNPPNAT